MATKITAKMVRDALKNPDRFTKNADAWLVLHGGEVWVTNSFFATRLNPAIARALAGWNIDPTQPNQAITINGTSVRSEQWELEQMPQVGSIVSAADKDSTGEVMAAKHGGNQVYVYGGARGNLLRGFVIDGVPMGLNDLYLTVMTGGGKFDLFELGTSITEQGLKPVTVRRSGVLLGIVMPTRLGM